MCLSIRDRSNMPWPKSGTRASITYNRFGTTVRIQYKSANMDFIPDSHCRAQVMLALVPKFGRGELRRSRIGVYMCMLFF